MHYRTIELAYNLIIRIPVFHVQSTFVFLVLRIVLSKNDSA